MPQCPNCSTELPQGGVACSSCGADVSLWIGRGGEVYGPYTLADLQQAQAEKRLGSGDRVMIGSEGQWRPLGEVMADAPPKAPLRPAPPPPPHAAPPAAAKPHDPTLVIILVVMGLFAVMVFAIVAAILFPVFARAREKARQTSCLSNVRQLNLGLLMYCQDYSEQFPPGPPAGVMQRGWPVPAGSQALPTTVLSPYPPGDWRADIYPYVRNSQIFICPSTENPDSYQFNDKLYSLKLKQIKQPAKTLSLFEKGFLDHSSPPPHNDGYNVGFVDGHGKWQRDTQNLITEP